MSNDFNVYDNLKQMKFHESKLQFKEGQKLLSSVVKGDFTRNEILEKMRNIVLTLRKGGQNCYIGASAHYANPNDWLPAIYTPIAQEPKLFNPSDSDGTGGYKDIDAVQFNVIVMPKGKVFKQQMHTVSKAHTEALFNNNQESMFSKSNKNKK